MSLKILRLTGIILTILLVISLMPAGFFLFLQSSRDALAQSGPGSESKWNGEYQSFHREEGSAAGLSGSFEEKESGTISFNIDSSGIVKGTGSGHFYYTDLFDIEGETCSRKGDSAYTFSFNGIIYGENFDSLELGYYTNASPATFTIIDSCYGMSMPSDLVPLTFSGCCLIPSIILKLENASRFHYYNTTTDGPSKTTTSVDLTIFVPACQASFAGGFEPVQAVWQDDELFPDQPGKQLTKVDDRSYLAELPMVNGKLTLLSGTKGSRDTIIFGGDVGYTINVPATVRFTLHDAAGDRTLYQYDAGELPLSGPCGQNQKIIIPIETKEFYSKPFKFSGAGPYTITMELVKSNGKVIKDSQITVMGNVQSVKGFSVAFVPIYLKTPESNQADDLVFSAKSMANNFATYAPDFYPLAPGSIKAHTNLQATDVSDAYSECITEEEAGDSGVSLCLASRLVKLGTTDGWLTATDRVVLVLGSQDFAELAHGIFGSADYAKAWASANKGIFLRSDAEPEDVAHEIAHTLPTFPWLGDDDSAACGVQYHNNGNYGNGFQVTEGAKPAHLIRDKVQGIMGSDIEGPTGYWIEQCTYWHLIHALSQGASDPLVLGVRGWIDVRDSGRPSAGFDPGYSFQGEQDLNSSSIGDYSIVFKTQSGMELARYRFNMTFATDAGFRLPLQEFAFRLDMPQEASELDLLGLDGSLLASEKIPTSSPTVMITSPGEGEGDEVSTIKEPIIASWSGAGGNNLTYSVFVSSDNGTNWNPLVVDTNATSAPIDSKLLSPGTKNELQVVATDGFHSQSSFVHFALPSSAMGTPVSSKTDNNNTASNKQSDSTAPKSGCLIATAAFGSELASQVQFLRTFRDERILSTASGTSFMDVFNAWYYFFSPRVADYERTQPWMQQTVRVAIYPLLGILQLAEKSYELAPGEYGSLIAGLVASSLIGATYFTPVALSLKPVRRRGLDPGIALAITLSLTAGVLISLTMGNAPIVMITTSALVLSVLSIAAIYGARMISIAMTFLLGKKSNQSTKK